MAVSVDQFVRHLLESGLMPDDELAAFCRTLPQQPDTVDELARALIQAGKLTKYQAAALYQGKTNGLVLGNYVILDQLGEGGMGQVFRARHSRMDRLVALKVLSPRVNKDKGAVKRFLREVKAAAKLTHPNVVASYDADEAGGTHFLVMEHVAGNDLAQFVKQVGPLPPRQAMECILQAARGLSYAHGEGVIHRDIKPANLLLDETGRVKVLDMGLARLETLDPNAATGDELTETGSVMGTIDYMAPEQAADSKTADARSDIYSLGCTLHYLLTGRPVYRADTMISRVMAHREQPIPSLCEVRPDVSTELDTIFQKMVAKEQLLRYQTMKDVVADLESIVGTSGPIAGVAAAATATPADNDSQLLNFLAGLSHQTAPVVTAKKTHAAAETMADVSVDATLAQQPTQVTATSAPHAGRRPPIGILIGAGIAAALLFAVVAVFFNNNNDKLSIENVEQQTAQNPLPPVALAPFTADEAATHQAAWAKYLGTEVELTNSIGMRLRLIPPGTFRMGSTSAAIDFYLKEYEDDHSIGKLAYGSRIKKEDPQHPVTLSRPFYFGTHEVTQAEYQQVMRSNPSHFSPDGGGKRDVQGIDTDRLPVETVPWLDAVRFCNRLSERENVTPFYKIDGENVTRTDGNGYRLPTEAEWEFACRAGTTTTYFSGDSPLNHDAFAWHKDNSARHTHAVGSKSPNPFGLYDVNGNVWEWCYDRGLFPYSASPATNPANGGKNAGQRAVRGGSFDFSVQESRSANRGNWGAKDPSNFIGFRIVRHLNLPTGINNTTPPIGSRNYALAFDGQDDYVDIPTLLYKGGHPLTIEARIRLATDAESGAVVVSPGNHPLLRPSHISGRANDSQWYTRRWAGPSIRETTVNVAGVYDGKTLLLFVDGMLTSKPVELVHGDSPLNPTKQLGFGNQFPGEHATIGCVSPQNPVEEFRHLFKGIIDELRISNTARYDKDFTPPKRFTTDKQTLALYHFDEGDGEILKDSSGNNHHGKIIGAKWVNADGTPTHSTRSHAIDLINRLGGTLSVIDEKQGNQRQVTRAAEITGDEWNWLSIDLDNVDSLTTADLQELLVAISNPVHLHLPKRAHTSKLLPVVREAASKVENATAEVTVATRIHGQRHSGIIFLGLPNGADDTHLGMLTEFRWLDGVQCNGCTQLTDAGLRKLIEHPNARRFRVLLASSTKFSDEGLIDFVSVAQDIRALNLGRSGITDTGLAKFGTLPELHSLHVYDTAITDQGLAALDKSSLTLIDVTETKVTPAGITRFRRQHPDCKIIWDGGTLEPGETSNNYALQFDGVDDYVAFDRLAPQTDSPMTIEAFVQYESVGETPATIIGRGGSLSLRITNPEFGPKWYFTWADSGPGNPAIFSRIPAKQSRKMHLATVWQNKKVRFFVNGVLQQAETDFEYRQSPLKLTFGAGGTNKGQFFHFHGLIDEVRISNTARYTKDFKTESRFQPDKQTLALYHFDEGDGEVLKDASGNNHHGKISGATWVRVDDELKVISNAGDSGPVVAPVP